MIFFCGDNCRVNIKLSNDTDIPLIGCASHRFNLAVQEYLNIYSDLLDNIDELMNMLLDFVIIQTLPL